MNKQTQYTRGSALLIMILLFMFGSLVVTLGIGRTVYYDMLRARQELASKQTFFTAESGIEDVTYRIRKSKMVDTCINCSEMLTIYDTVAVTRTTVASDVSTLRTEGIGDSTYYRSGEVVLRLGSGASFGFGLQSDTGGISMYNTSGVVGNIYSNGPVSGASSNMVYGSVVSAGPTGLVDGIHATGSVWSNRIQSSRVDKDAYYQSISGTIVSGTSYPGSANQPPSTLPITDAMIDDWKIDAAGGGTISGAVLCPGGVYTIDSDVSIGNKKIECDVVIEKNTTDVTLTGPLWISGNLTLRNGPRLRVDASLSDTSIQIVVDNPLDRLTSSKISLINSTGFIGASGASYILLISMNNSSELGGTEVAIDADNNSPSGEGEVIYYAPHGLLQASNSIKLRGATAHHIVLRNSALVEYETGMVSLLFTGGVSGSFVLSTWRETE